jgi:hypothetical protein
MTNLESLLKKENITEAELKAILKSSKNRPLQTKKLGISGRHVKYGYFSDAHIGHKMFHPELWDKMVRLFKKEGVEFILDIGDHLEGMSGRPGHVYELSHVGFDQQINYAIELYKQLPVNTYGIDGNHDQWYYKNCNGGIIVGGELENRVGAYTHLGQDEADLEIAPGVMVKLFHANDGSAYALSYKLQKLIESFTGGEKPHIVHSGHYHKHLTMYLRNVFGVECGTLMGQSRWMRGKKIPAHMGFGIMDVYFNKKGIDRINHTWVPYFENNSER